MCKWICSWKVMLFTSLAHRLALNRIVKYKYVITICHFKAWFMASNAHIQSRDCVNINLFCKEEIFSNILLRDWCYLYVLFFDEAVQCSISASTWSGFSVGGVLYWVTAALLLWWWKGHPLKLNGVQLPLWMMCTRCRKNSAQTQEPECRRHDARPDLPAPNICLNHILVSHAVSLQSLKAV